MSTFDLTAEEERALVALLRRALDDARFPLAPRLAPLKAILAKLDPPKPIADQPPPIRSGLTPRVRRARRR